MSQFVVPQFIDVEDKILGPITTRQFAIIMVTALVLFILYKILTTIDPINGLWYTLAVDLPLLGAALTLAFVRINGQPFHYFLLNFFQTFRRPNVRVWNKDLTDAEIIALAKVEIPLPPPPKIYKEAPTTSRLSELALIVNTGGVYHPED